MSDFVIENGVLKKYTGPGGDIVIPAGVTKVGFGAFEDCDALTNVVIPEGVTIIENYAFRGCGKLESVMIPSTMLVISSVAFECCDNLKQIVTMQGKASGYIAQTTFPLPWEGPLIYPKLLPGVFRDAEIKLRLALGYCTAPEKYEEPWAGQYRLYVKRQSERLLAMAEKLNLPDAAAYCARICEEKPKKSYSKLSDHAKAELLEKSVLSMSAQELGELCDQLGKVPYTARALGIACGYGGLEKVKVLAEHGADFGMNPETAARRYGACYRSGVGRTYPAMYWLLLAYDGSDVKMPTLYAGTKDYRLGGLPDLDPLLSQEERAEIARYLLGRGCPGLDAGELLYYAVLWNDAPLADMLADDGVKLPEYERWFLTHTDRSLDYEELLVTLMQKSAKECLESLTRFAQLLEPSGEKLTFTNSVFTKEPTPFLDEQVIKFVLERTNTEKLNRRNLLELSVKSDAAGALAVSEELGWLKTSVQRDKLIDLAISENKTQALAWLLDYKNRTSDIAAEAARREKKMMRELTEAPDSVSALKKIWTWKKLEDGTLCLTSYKGTETEVVIPNRIGKNAVTALERTFSCAVPRLTQKAENTRRNITAVTIPAGVRSVGTDAFGGCASLRSIALPESVTAIGGGAFSSCGSLKSMTIPAGVMTIRSYTFFWCASLTSVTIPKSVTNIEIQAFDHCPNLTIHALPGSYAEVYAKENNIPFQAI